MPFSGALTQKSVEKGHSYLADKNVSVCISSDDKQSNDYLSS